MLIPDSCILTMVIIFNASGTYFLKLTNRNGSCNQMMILISLSACNIILSIFWLGDVVITHFDAKETMFYYRWWPFLGGSYIVWYLMILILTIDRFIGCNFPIKHKIFVRKRLILGTIIICWLFGLTLAVIGSLVGGTKLRPTITFYLWPTLDTLFMLLFVVTYGSIFCVLLRRRFKAHISHQNPDQSQFIVTVTALLFCFLALEAIPSIILVFLESPSTTFVKVQSTIYKINLLCDPLIYIFLQKKVRDVARDKLRRLAKILFCRTFNRLFDLEKQRNLNPKKTLDN